MMDDLQKLGELVNDELSNNRSFRAIFDCTSPEWEDASMESKEALLMRLYLSDQKIDYYLEGYKDYYRKLAAGPKVLKALAKSIRFLVLNVRDESLRTTLLKIYVSIGNEKNDK